jgi:cation:H+ antiporter
MLSLMIAQVAASLALLYFGGEFLVRGAASLASRLAVSSLAVGLTVVAFGTSAPELAVSLDAALSGADDVSVGNVIGSNIANIVLILGLAAVIRPIRVDTRLIRIHVPIMILVSGALVVILADGRASRIEGTFLLLALVTYVVFVFWEARHEPAPVREEIAAAVPQRLPGAALGALFVVLGLALLVLGGQLLVSAAVALAVSVGVSQAVIGLTIVAVGTSLPEFATTVIASVRGNGSIAIGNVVGSNTFNVLGIFGLTTLLQPLEMAGMAWLDLGTLLGTACLLGVFVFTGRRLSRPEGVLLVTIFVGYTVWRLVS